MRLLKVLLAALFAAVAIVAGLVAAAVVAASALAIFLASRLSRRFGTPKISPPQGRASEPVPPGDVIEVTATEVRADRAIQ